MTSGMPRNKINKMKFDVRFPGATGVLRIEIPDIPFKAIEEVFRAGPASLFGAAVGVVAWRGHRELGLYAKGDLEWVEHDEYRRIKSGAQAFGVLKDPPPEGFESAPAGTQGRLWSATMGDGTWTLREYRVVQT